MPLKEVIVDRGNPIRTEVSEASDPARGLTASEEEARWLSAQPGGSHGKSMGSWYADWRIDTGRIVGGRHEMEPAVHAVASRLRLRGY